MWTSMLEHVFFMCSLHYSVLKFCSILGKKTDSYKLAFVSVWQSMDDGLL